MSWDTAKPENMGDWPSDAREYASAQNENDDVFGDSAEVNDTKGPRAVNGDGGCFNCGEDGHMKSECPNPKVAREFTGTCRNCAKEGHRAADCPDAESAICLNCLQDGHDAFKCENPRKINYDDVEEILPEHAWKQLETASEGMDIDEIKEALAKYIKAVGDTTYQQLELAFRGQNLNVYYIAVERECASTFTYMDLQGNLDRKYLVMLRTSPHSRRPKESENWPNQEENFERLKDAGEPVDRLVPLCSNCDQLGHTKRNCTEEIQVNDGRAEVKCYNCEELGHRVRDCPNPRPDRFACRNCKQSGHNSKDCPEPRSAEDVECKNCNKMGHFSRDCPDGGGGYECRNCGGQGHKAADCTEPPKCRNCDEIGHTGKECPKPRDYSRVKCSNCQEMGHTKVRCKQPLKEEESDGHEFGGAAPADIHGAFNGGNDAFATGGSNHSGVAATAGDSWEAAGAAAKSEW